MVYWTDAMKLRYVPSSTTTCHPRLTVECSRSHTDRTVAQKKMGPFGLNKRGGCGVLGFLHAYSTNTLFHDIWSFLGYEHGHNRNCKHAAASVGFPYVNYWGWRTRAQIIALHGGDAKAADEIIAEKVAGGMVQDHPDSAQLKTYFVPPII